jgi:transposase
VPDNITLLSLPPYAPELNPMELVWEYLRGNKLCALVWDTYDAIVEACRKAWQFLTDDPDRILGLSHIRKQSEEERLIPSGEVHFAGD